MRGRIIWLALLVAGAVLWMAAVLVADLTGGELAALVAAETAFLVGMRGLERELRARTEGSAEEVTP